MPELPEVQTTINDLNKEIIKRRITGVWFDAPSLIKKPKPKELEKQIKGLKIMGIKRRGKNILIYLSKNYLLLIHQKLTGHLLVGKWRIIKGQARSLIKGPLEERVNVYIHLIFYLDNGCMLALSDLRKFAKVLFGPKEEIENSPDLAELGQEPLEKRFKVEKFKNLISQEKRKIKQVLMDQKIIAGIGNIYSDEILWQAKINPLKPVNQLRVSELTSLYLAMKQILKKAIKLRGVSISDYRDTAGKSGNYAEIRSVYQRENEPCRRCKTLIKRVKIGGRSAHFCPKCQK